MAREWYPNGIYITIAPFILTLAMGRHPRNGQPNVCNGPAGYKADSLTGCETYYYCHTDGLKEAFACPFGMLFDERRGQCDTWNNVNCPLPGQPPQSAASSGILSVPEGAPPLSNAPPPPPPAQQQHQPQYPSYALPNNPGGGPSNAPVPSANLGANSNAMDFLAALLFPPLSGQHDLNDFVNTAPSGVRQSFMRVAGEGQMTPNQYGPPQAYVEPLGPGSGPGSNNGNQQPYYQQQQQPRPVYPQQQQLPEQGLQQVEGAPPPPPRGRETPGSSGTSGFRRMIRPSPAMNPLDAPSMTMMESMVPLPPQHQQNQQAYVNSGPVPPHLMGGHSSYMFGQLNMLQQQQQQNQTGLGGGPVPVVGGVPGSSGLAPVAGLSQSAQVEALRPLMQSLMRNPHQPHLRRMASLIAGATAMDMGLVNGKLVTDPLGAAAADPALATGKKNKALDDGLVDAR